MNKFSLIGITMLVGSAMSTPAMSQSFSPANAYVYAQGELTFNIGGPGNVKCVAVSLDGPTGPSGGSFQMVGGIGAPCPAINVARTNYTITSVTATGGTGTAYATILFNGTVACSGPLAFTWINNGSNPSTIKFATNVGSCSINGSLKTVGTDVNIVP